MAQAVARKSTAVAKRPAAKPATTKAKATPVPLWEVVSEIDEDLNFRARILGAEFTISSEMNQWYLYLTMGENGGRWLAPLIQSVVVVVPQGDETDDQARRRTDNELNAAMFSRKALTTEQIMEIAAGMMEMAAGKDL